MCQSPAGVTGGRRGAHSRLKRPAETNHAHLAHPGAGPSHRGLSLAVPSASSSEEEERRAGPRSSIAPESVRHVLPHAHLTSQAGTRTGPRPSHCKTLQRLRGKCAASAKQTPFLVSQRSSLFGRNWHLPSFILELWLCTGKHYFQQHLRISRLTWLQRTVNIFLLIPDLLPSGCGQLSH